MNEGKLIRTPRYGGDQRHNIYDARVGAEAISKILEIHNGLIDYYYLNKLLYLIERTSLIRYNMPMFFDTLYSIQYGPIGEGLKDQTNREPSADSNFVRELDHKIRLVRPTTYNSLSPRDVRLIEEQSERLMSEMGKRRYENRSNFDLTHDFVMTLPEYEPVITGRKPIYYETIFSGESFSESSIEKIINSINAEAYLNLLACIG